MKTDRHKQRQNTLKLLKIGTPEKFAVITLKFEQSGLTLIE